MNAENLINDKNELRKFFISDDDYDEFLKQVNRNNKIIRLAEKVSDSERSHNYFNIIKYKKQIEEEIVRMIKRYVERNKERQERIDLSVMTLSEEEKQTLSEQTISICMCCDMIESFCMKIEEIFSKHDDLKLIHFIGLKKLISESRNHLRWLQKETELRDYENWGDACDFYIDSIPKRAAKLMKSLDDRKRRKK